MNIILLILIAVIYMIIVHNFNLYRDIQDNRTQIEMLKIQVDLVRLRGEQDVNHHKTEEL